MRCVTFYSYKGGVGRSMAVANVAIEAANRHKLRVLAIDWDLEAPGLHAYLGLTQDDLADRLGLLDYLERRREAFIDIDRDRRRAVDGHQADLMDFISAPARPVIEEIEAGSVHLMTCGQLDERYFRRLAAFDWQRFYADAGGFWVVERLRREALGSFDLVLIDAPASRSELSAVPLAHMADLIVMMFAANGQSLAGTTSVAHALKRNRDPEMGRDRPLSIMLVPSRVDLENPSVVEWLRRDVPSATSELTRRGVLEPGQPSPALVFAVEPGLPVGERVLSTGRDGEVRGRLRDSYALLADVLARVSKGGK